MCVGMFLVLLDVTVINVALPSIRTGLHASIGELQWVVAGYTLTFALVLLPGGALGDRLGHRRTLHLGMFAFAVASVAGGLAPSGAALVGARAVQGVGAALLLPASVAVIMHTFPDRREQARALGIWAGVSALALPAGPVLGGLLVTAAGWRAVFWINLPIIAVAAVLSTKIAPASGQRHQHGIAALFMDRQFVGANLVSLAMNFVGIGTIFVATLYLQEVRHSSPLIGGLALVPVFAPLAVLSPITGRLTARFGPRPPMAAGLALGAVGSAFFGVLVEPALVALGIGMGLLTAAVVAAAMAAAPPERSGLAAGVNNTARQAGGALGTAVYGAIAGDPVDPGRFLSGMHTAGLVGAGVWLAALVVTLVTVRAGPGSPRSRRSSPRPDAAQTRAPASPSPR
jgi:DHA2 family methylenomycin A resistance protein-like MFS transporter